MPGRGRVAAAAHIHDRTGELPWPLDSWPDISTPPSANTQGTNRPWAQRTPSFVSPRLASVCECVDRQKFIDVENWKKYIARPSPGVMTASVIENDQPGPIILLRGRIWPMSRRKGLLSCMAPIVIASQQTVGHPESPEGIQVSHARRKPQATDCGKQKPAPWSFETTPRHMVGKLWLHYASQNTAAVVTTLANKERLTGQNVM